MMDTSYIVYFLFGNKRKIFGTSIIVVMMLITIFAEQIAPYDPLAMDFKPFLSPSTEHWLGTDNLGQDIYSQLIMSSRTSLSIGLIAATMVVFVGLTFGLIAGYKSGIIENTLMGTTDLFILIPSLPLTIILISYMGPSVYNIIIVITLLSWCGTARIVHSRVLQVKEQSFIESARMMAFSDRHIMFKHILKNTEDVLLARWCLAIVAAMMAEAGLAFLGLGDPFHVSWGGMITDAFSNGGYVRGMWWRYVMPGAMISLVALAFFMLASFDKDHIYVEA